MLNPIAFTENVIADFLRYQITTYPFSDTNLYAQLRALLNLDQTRNTPLLAGPYISLSRTFRAGATYVQLASEGIVHPLIANLSANPHAYGHQETAMRAIAGGKHTLVSTGTGSGKTEAFLYPIISHCLRLREQKAPAGIAAVIVYPMNALAEDQLGRMRDLLAGTGITFGMYVGKTPEHAADAAGQRLPRGSSRADYRAAVEKAKNEGRPDAIFPPEERASRDEMREAGSQPRILLTNVKQLELLLTRHKDVELFQNVQLQYLVFDEAHTFSGAAGAETALLIRRLRTFCGRAPDETVCIATSATIVDPARGADAGRDFAQRFFGVDPAQVVLVGEEYEADVWSDQRTIPPAPVGDPAAQLGNILEAIDLDDNGETLRRTYQALVGKRLPADAWKEALYDQLASNEVAWQIVEALQSPRSLADLVQELAGRVGRSVPEEEVLIWLALGAASLKKGRPLIRPVVHAFVRGISGAVVTFPEQLPRPKLSLAASDEQDVQESEQHLPLHVLTCTTCGQHYFEHFVEDFQFEAKRPDGGSLFGDARVWPTLAKAQGGERVLLIDRQITNDEEGGEEQTTPSSTHPLYYCRYCGSLHLSDQAACATCGRAPALIRLFAIQSKGENRGLLNKCVSCGTQGRSGFGGYREPIRAVRATTVSDVHVLAQNMIQYAERRRLLVFADNRQDAAFQAGWMQDHARRFRLRSLMYEQVQRGAISIGDLTAELSIQLEGDDELSQSLLPEVWRAYRKEAAGVRHRSERDYFLRIQVLRELTTGVKQRIGLEPWGRIRVDYFGLDPASSFVKDWSARLGLSHEELCNGIASLLDQERRSNTLLHDRQHDLFGRFWSEGDREILSGYMPLLPGGPKGLKLTRSEEDNSNRVSHWLAAKGQTTSMKKALAWGVSKEEVSAFLTELWSLLTEESHLLVPVTLHTSKGKNVSSASGVYQIDADRILIQSGNGTYQCTSCRRVHPRSTPKNACMGYNCTGTIRFVPENPDDYNLAVLDKRFEMLRAREHSAQVPAEERERLENFFKGPTEIINTLVCTPTLELGVNIGTLDSVIRQSPRLHLIGV